MVEGRDRANSPEHHEFELNSFRDSVPTLELTHDFPQPDSNQVETEFKPTEENPVPPVATGADPAIKL